MKVKNSQWADPLLDPSEEYEEIGIGLYFMAMASIFASLTSVLGVILVLWLCRRMCLFLGSMLKNLK